MAIHDKSHAIDSTGDHSSSIVEDNFITADANGLPKDSSIGWVPEYAGVNPPLYNSDGIEGQTVINGVYKYECITTGTGGAGRWGRLTMAIAGF
jgi:hypothetical protein